MSENPNDPLRRKILEYLHELHRAQRGKYRHETTGREITENVSARTGATLEVLASNLLYLVDTGFVKHRKMPRFLSSGTQVEMDVYSIAGPGLRVIEGKSDFMPPMSPASVSVEIRNGVVTVIQGANNTVTVGRNELPAILAALEKFIKSNRDLSEAVRRDALADLETVRAQSSKSKPDMGIIRTAWEGVKIAVTAGEATILLQQAAALLGLP